MATTGSRPRPQAGKDYPKDYADFLGRFPDDAACLDYLDGLRWPDGFSGPDCSDGTGWRMSDDGVGCKACRRRMSATAGTIFHRTKTPLTIWFAKNGVSAKTLHRLRGLGPTKPLGRCCTDFVVPLGTLNARDFQRCGGG